MRGRVRDLRHVREDAGWPPPAAPWPGLTMVEGDRCVAAWHRDPGGLARCDRRGPGHRSASRREERRSMERSWTFDRLAVTMRRVDFLDPALAGQPDARERGVRVEIKP